MGSTPARRAKNSRILVGSCHEARSHATQAREFDAHHFNAGGRSARFAIDADDRAFKAQIEVVRCVHEVIGNPPAEFGKFIDAELKRYAEIARVARIKLE